MTDKLKVLLLASDSFDLFYLRSGDEQRLIQNRLEAGPHGNRFDVILRPPLRISDLGEALMKYEPDIMHLSAEGRVAEGIILEDDQGDPKGVRAEDLAALVRELKGNIQLVFLNACYTREHAEAISQDIDYVIGMDGKVEEKTAMVFAHHFYQAVGYGKTVNEAYRVAVRQVKMEGHADSELPVLRVKPGVDVSRPLLNLKPVESEEASKPELDVILSNQGNQFVKQLGIAAHFQDANDSQQAIYFDDSLYVHRVQAETALLQHAESFAGSGSPQGKWVCIIGDAGHGKSSLLWYLYESLKEHAKLKILPFLAQMEGHWDSIGATALKIRSLMHDPYKVIVIIDTLDILVGIGDPSLASMLNSLRSSGCLLITTSRRQEAERIFRITPSDNQIELKRFNDGEAQQAIRNFVNRAFTWWSVKDRERQIDKVWGILEQQRKVRELDLEPLILRMFFEVYVPNDIPRDINTQQVYKRFWDKRVLLDRAVKDAGEKFIREQLCRLAARQLRCGGGHSDKLSVDRLQRAWRETQFGLFPHSVLEGLVSTGVLQWAEGMSTFRFFHQTFFEYTAAYDLLSSDEPVIEEGIKSLLGEVAKSNLFQAPILKQFAIQAFESGSDRWKEVLQGLRQINHELAARLALEIVGKLPEDSFSTQLCRGWISSDSGKLQSVICETVKHYPRSKTGMALELLEPYVEGPKAKIIYSVCGETFAKDEPGQVCEFLRRLLPRIIHASDDEQKHYKEALCSTLQHGAVEALHVLNDLFPHLKPGQQSGLLHKIAEGITVASADEVASFLKSVVNLMPRLNLTRPAEVWDGIMSVARRLHEVSSVRGSELARWLFETGQWKEDKTAAMYTGMIIGPTVSDQLIVYQGLLAVSYDDHFLRLLYAGILSSLPERFSADLMSRINSLEKGLYQTEGKIGSLFNIVAGLKGVEPAALLRFLGEWPWQDMGVGTPLRRIIEYLAVTGPVATKEWLFNQLDATTGPASPKLFSGFNILLQKDAGAFTPDEVGRLYDIAFASSKTLRQIFAGTTGSIAGIDRQLAEEIFLRVFTSEGKDTQVAAVTSLANCLETCPEFAIDQARRVLDKALSTHNLGILHSYLVVLKELPRQYSGYLLQRLSDWFTEDILHSLRDVKTFGELLTILKIVAEADPKFTFAFSKRIPILNKAVAGGLAPVYDQISEHSEDETLLLELLESIPEVARFDQVRIPNALRRMLPRLDRELGGRKVINMVFRSYKHIPTEQALRAFIEAALRVPSWTEEDTRTLLADSDLPGAVRGLLATKITR